MTEPAYLITTIVTIRGTAAARARFTEQLAGREFSLATFYPPPEILSPAGATAWMEDCWGCPEDVWEVTGREEEGALSWRMRASYEIGPWAAHVSHLLHPECVLEYAQAWVGTDTGLDVALVGRWSAGVEIARLRCVAYGAPEGIAWDTRRLREEARRALEISGYAELLPEED